MCSASKASFDCAGKRFFLTTFGCKVNQYESEALREAWESLGMVECAHPREADFIVVNSCAITAKGERDSRQAVCRLRKKAPLATLFLVGCATTCIRDDGSFGERIHIVPNKAKPLLLTLSGLERLLLGETDGSPEPAEDGYPTFAITRYPRARPVLKVQDGCSHRCTYCIVPTARSRPMSRPYAEVLAEASVLLGKGYGELILSGINLKQYHADCGDFWDLLAALDRDLAPHFAGKARIRISSVEPSQLSAKGLSVLAHSVLLCPHLHISLQHTAQNILRRMGRGHYSAFDLAQALEKLAWPVFGLGCDLIIGFPGETERDVDDLCAFCKELPFTYAHVFPYSRRPGTAAAHFPDQVPEACAAERARRVRELFYEKNKDFRARLVGLGQKLTIVPEEGSPVKGLCEYAVTCVSDGSVPFSRGLVSVRAKALVQKGLLVEKA